MTTITKYCTSNLVKNVDYECVKFIMKNIKKMYPKVVTKSCGYSYEKYLIKEMPSDSAGYLFANIYKNGNKKNKDRKNHKITLGNKVAIDWDFNDNSIKDEIISNMNKLALTYGKGHFIYYDGDDKKIFLCRNKK